MQNNEDGPLAYPELSSGIFKYTTEKKHMINK